MAYNCDQLLSAPNKETVKNEIDYMIYLYNEHFPKPNANYEDRMV